MAKGATEKGGRTWTSLPPPPAPNRHQPPSKKRCNPAKKHWETSQHPFMRCLSGGTKTDKSSNHFQATAKSCNSSVQRPGPRHRPEDCVQSRPCSRTCLLGGQALESCKIETPKSSKERLTPNWRVACGTPSTPIEWLYWHTLQESDNIRSGSSGVSQENNRDPKGGGHENPKPGIAPRETLKERPAKFNREQLVNPNAARGARNRESYNRSKR